MGSVMCIRDREIGCCGPAYSLFTACSNSFAVKGFLLSLDKRPVAVVRLIFCSHLGPKLQGLQPCKQLAHPQAAPNQLSNSFSPNSFAVKGFLLTLDKRSVAVVRVIFCSQLAPKRQGLQLAISPHSPRQLRISTQTVFPQTALLLRGSYFR